MPEEFIPDYSTYDNKLLIDVYTRIDRTNSPLKAQAVDDEIKKRFNLPPGTNMDSETVKKYFQNKVTHNKSDLSKSEEMIKQGWIAGLALAGISFFFWLISLLADKIGDNGSNSIYTIIDIIIIIALSNGIYMKSRVCAILLASYYILFKLLYISAIPVPQNLLGVVGLIVFSPFFIRAIIGAFNYHKINSTKNLEIL